MDPQSDSPSSIPPQRDDNLQPADDDPLASLLRHLKSVYDSFPKKVYPPVYSPPRIIIPKESSEAAALSVVSTDPVLQSEAINKDDLILVSRLPTVYVYGPGWKGNWPSFDLDCLVWQSFLRFSKVKFDINNCNESLMSPSGRLPFLVTERGKVYSGQADMMRYVSNKFTDINKSLTEAESAESDIFISLVENKLYPALLYNFWCESDNYHQSTKKLYGRNYPWPLNELITWNARRNISSLLEKRFNAVLADDIYNDASTALEALSTKLGDRQYFFNDSPTFVDALLFSHLHTILSVSLPTNKLRNLVLERENLVNYARKIWNLWFKDSGSASTMGRKASRSGTNTPFIGIK